MLLSESSVRRRREGLESKPTELYRGSVSFAKGDDGFAIIEFAHDERIIDQRRKYDAFLHFLYII